MSRVNEILWSEHSWVNVELLIILYKVVQFSIHADFISVSFSDGQHVHTDLTL